MSLSRRELFSRLGLIRIVDPLTESAYESYEQTIYEDDLDSSPHGRPWHTSFHGSAFPGDDKKACARKALYSLINIPDKSPVDTRGRQLMDTGKDIEVQIVRRWEKAGMLLSAGPDEQTQTGFALPEFWLTCSTDAVVQPPGWDRGHVVEIKTKSDQAVTDMRRGRRTYDPYHRKQLLCTIAMAHLFSRKLWPELDTVRDGSLYYVSRENPRNTMEYWFDLDLEFFEAGLDQLERWRQLFFWEELPERDKSWRWTEQPCQYCAVKRLCKADHKDNIRNLRGSHAIKFAESIRTDYDYGHTREKVLERWA